MKFLSAIRPFSTHNDGVKRAYLRAKVGTYLLRVVEMLPEAAAVVELARDAVSGQSYQSKLLGNHWQRLHPGMWSPHPLLQEAMYKAHPRHIEVVVAMEEFPLRCRLGNSVIR